LGNHWKEIDQLFNIKGIYVGDRVIRGPDWKWGDQDGGKQNNSNYPYLNGTIRGLSQWHPKDKDTLITNVIVVWDHGIYGNYRYNYRGAFDIRVTKRYEKLPLITVGNQVKRGQKLWRWNNQDGGIGKKVILLKFMLHQHHLKLVYVLQFYGIKIKKNIKKKLNN